MAESRAFIVDFSPFEAVWDHLRHGICEPFRGPGGEAAEPATERSAILHLTGSILGVPSLPTYGGIGRRRERMRGERGIREAVGLADIEAESPTWEASAASVARSTDLSELEALDLQRDLTGRRVVIGSSSSPGSVMDLLLDVLAGRVEGIVCRTSPEPNGRYPRVLVSHLERAEFSQDGALIVACSKVSPAGFLSPVVDDGEWRRASPTLVLASGELQGARVVTRDGRLIGQVVEIYLVPRILRVFYRVSASRWRRILGEDGYLRGDLPYGYSRDARRLFVPAEITARQLFPTLSAAIEDWTVRPSSIPDPSSHRSRAGSRLDHP